MFDLCDHLTSALSCHVESLRLRRIGVQLGDQCKRGVLTSFIHVGMLLLEGLREKSVVL